MKAFRLVPVLLLGLYATAFSADARFMTHPDISGGRIVFTYEGDLWMVDAAGGRATRLTSFPGEEFAAKFSPDGRFLAFTAGYDGAQSVYLMPADGGVPKRLTYMPGRAQTVAWTPDGQRVVFRSDAEQSISRTGNLFAVGLEGTAPERLPIDRGVLCSFSADGSEMLYMRRGNEEYQWKRYRGGRTCDIWRYSFKTRAFAPVSDTAAKNAYPMWIGERMCFASDRGGTTNLYWQDLKSGRVEPATRHESYDVMWPETDGRRIVYVQDGFLWTLEVAGGENRRLEIGLPSDRWLVRDRWLDARDYIHDADLAGDGQQIVLEARGDLFLVSRKTGLARNLSASPGTREIHPRFSPDGQWLAYFSDRSGEYQLCIQKRSGGEPQQLTTTLDRAVYRPSWSPDGKKILFGNKDLALFCYDLDQKQLVKIDEVNQLKNDEFTWKIDDYSWSPDSQFVCYTTVARNRNSQVFIYSLEQKKKFAVSDDFYNNLNPCFDVNGDYLYYLSSRNFAIGMDFYEDNHVVSAPYQVLAVQLQAGQKPPFADDGDESTPAKAAAPAAGRVRIDFEGLAQRTFPLPLPAGNYFYLRAGRGKVLFCSVPAFTEDEYEEIFQPGGQTKWTLHIFDMKEKKAVEIEGPISQFLLAAGGEQLLAIRSREYYPADLGGLYKSKKLGEKVALGGLYYWLDVAAEWNQIFSDTWRWYRDFFYDADMHGHDWKQLGERYRAMIPHLSSRDGLNWLLSQMVGELCVGHAYIGGGDYGPLPLPRPQVYTGCLGADLAYDPGAGLFRFEKIYGPSEYNLDLRAPLVRPDLPIKEGDYLIAINGHALQKNEDYYRLLQVTRGQKISLTVNSLPGRQSARTYEVEPVASDRALRYNRWLTANIRKVLQATGGRVGYMHINAMGSGGIGEFDKFWRAFRYKEGIIIDVRRNSGGWTEYFLIDKLERRQVAWNQLRGMVPFHYPGSVGPLTYVAISNEDNGSDGEAFIKHFQARQLGRVVGVPSWGGLVGILNGQATVDNGGVQQPNNAFWGESGKWWVENEGAIPDIVVDNDPAAVMAGRDPQLEAAIAEVMAEIAKGPKVKLPARPAYPRR